VAAGVTTVIGYCQLLLAVAGALFALGLLILILVNRLEAKAAKATAIEAQRALRSTLAA
jgi:hypothetical protein